MYWHSEQTIFQSKVKDTTLSLCKYLFIHICRYWNIAQVMEYRRKTKRILIVANCQKKSRDCDSSQKDVLIDLKQSSDRVFLTHEVVYLK